MPTRFDGYSAARSAKRWPPVTVAPAWPAPCMIGMSTFISAGNPCFLIASKALVRSFLAISFFVILLSSLLSAYTKKFSFFQSQIKLQPFSSHMWKWVHSKNWFLWKQFVKDFTFCSGCTKTSSSCFLLPIFASTPESSPCPISRVSSVVAAVILQAPNPALPLPRPADRNQNQPESLRFPGPDVGPQLWETLPVQETERHSSVRSLFVHPPPPPPPPVDSAQHSCIHQPPDNRRFKWWNRFQWSRSVIQRGSEGQWLLKGNPLSQRTQDRQKDSR